MQRIWIHIRELGKYFEKCVQTECLNPCNCSGMTSYLQQINTKLDMLISRQGHGNMKLLTTPSTPAHIPVPNSHTNFGEDRETLSSLALPSIGFDVPAETEREYDHHTMSDDVSPVSTINLADSPDLTQTTTGTSAIRHAVFDEIFKESLSMTKYAKNLVFKLFSPAELQGSNCSGLKGKRPLKKDNRMDMIKSATYKKYHIEDKKKSWVMC